MKCARSVRDGFASSKEICQIQKTWMFITKVRTLMMEKGIPLNRGLWQITTVKVVDVHNVPESTYSSGEQEEESPPRVHTARLPKQDQRPTWRRSDMVFYLWSERSCGNCGRKGHDTSRCPRPRGKSIRGDRYAVGT